MDEQILDQDERGKRGRVGEGWCLKVQSNSKDMDEIAVPMEMRTVQVRVRGVLYCVVWYCTVHTAAMDRLSGAS